MERTALRAQLSAPSEITFLPLRGSFRRHEAWAPEAVEAVLFLFSFMGPVPVNLPFMGTVPMN